jgi:hypothetical protein
VEVHYSEGVAIRADFESCVAIREDGDEALTEERTGQPLSRERLIPDADTVTCADAPCFGTREILGLAGEHHRSASGRKRAVADDERSQEV